MTTAADTSTLRRRAIGALAAAAILAAAGSAVQRGGIPHGAPTMNPRITSAAVDDDEGRAPRERPAYEQQPAVAATFTSQSYAPDTTATLVLWKREARLSLQLFQVGPEQEVTYGHTSMNGLPVSAPISIAPHAAHTPIRIRVGSWPSGLYFARLEAGDGRMGFAPFVVRPRRLGVHNILVVLPTYTWQAYNFRDDNGDGWGDTWYAGWRQSWARLNRPFLSRGVPAHFRSYDLHFLQWLSRSSKQVDVFSDADLNRVASGADLRRAYGLIVFPGHHEYVTTHEYDVVGRYRDLGGNLMFLSANDFFWRITLHGGTMTRTKQWRQLGRPEASLIGVQFIGTDEGVHQGPWQVSTSAPSWLFAGTSAAEGGPFGHGGIEIDHTAPSSPRGIQVIAQMPHLFGPRFTAQMTYYEAPSGARVFAAGAFTLAGSALQPEVSRLLENLWQRLAPPAGEDV